MIDNFAVFSLCGYFMRLFNLIDNWSFLVFFKRDVKVKFIFLQSWAPFTEPQDERTVLAQCQVTSWVLTVIKNWTLLADSRTFLLLSVVRTLRYRRTIFVRIYFPVFFFFLIFLELPQQPVSWCKVEVGILTDRVLAKSI